MTFGPSSRLHRPQAGCLQDPGKPDLSVAHPGVGVPTASSGQGGVWSRGVQHAARRGWGGLLWSQAPSIRRFSKVTLAPCPLQAWISLTGTQCHSLEGEQSPPHDDHTAGLTSLCISLPRRGLRPLASPPHSAFARPDAAGGPSFPRDVPGHACPLPCFRLFPAP